MANRLQEIQNELLVLLAQGGEEVAMGELVRRWQARLLAHARRLTGDAHGAEEVVQETWMAVVRGIRKLQQPGAFGFWVYRIVGRQSVNWVRRTQRQRQIIVANAKTSATHVEPDGVMRALNDLSVEHREALVLHYLEGLSIAEIAETLGLREGTVKSRLHYAREAMRQAIGE
jgi:RNA polymerase sigma-70 factor (ECF subfamily)